MSQWGGQRSPTTASPDPEKQKQKQLSSPPSNDAPNVLKKTLNLDTANTPQSITNKNDPFTASPAPRSPATPSRARADSRANTRPNSMIQTYNPPQMEVANDTPPELAPIFSYLNSHSNKLYQEGYFLKLHDLDSRGRPSTDRVWNECFAQLVGTVLSLWDAAALDQAGEDGEVVPTFINLSDASIKMIESLPMNGAQGGSLQNVLSISTAANNRYLLHFNSLNSLTQWTAGIRLAMFEHSTLQEAYTGSLLAGKGKFLNNIKQIMDRSKFAHEDWARVRFGAGTPWKRCWCVISPPDEKEYQKAQKTLKKNSAYSRAQVPKGDIKFYDTRKVTKKTKPIATITDAFAAYAIYPQSKPLIDQSTLVKLEGLVTIHGGQETTTEGFVFVMPEVHPAVSGFEMMLRWLFPVFDTFALYGRPTRLIADTLDQRGLMFAMPRDRRYGYLDILDVSGLIHTDGSQNWSERQWRKEMKKLTSTRMATITEDSPRSSRQMAYRRNTTSRNSLPPVRGGVQFQEPAIHSSPGSRSGSPAARPGPDPVIKRTDSAPPAALHMSPHKRSASDVYGHRKHMVDTPSRLSYEQGRDDDDEPPAPPRHGGVLGAAVEAAPSPPPEPVLSPPAFQHNPNDRPPTHLNQAPELRRQHSNVDQATLNEMRDAVRPADEDYDYPQQPQAHPMPNGVALPYRNQQFASSDSSQQRLSTIPGSPYGSNDSEYFHEQGHMPQMDGLVEGAGETRPDPPQHLRSSHSIQRKPLPRPQEAGQAASRQQVRSTMEPDSPTSPVSATGSLMDFVDSDAIERILNDDGTSTLASSSSATPDYESVESSDHEVKKKPKEWVRPGKLKTVGDPEMQMAEVRGAGKLDTYNKDLEEQAAEIPTVSFGPTYSYKPTSRPGTSGTITPGDMDGKRSRSRSADKLRQSSGSRLSGFFGATPSPGETNRNSYFGGRTTPTGIEGEVPNHRHSIAWPGASPGQQGRASPEITMSKRKTLSPEDWVAHRAELAAQPQAPQRRSVVPPHLAHQRHASMSAVNTMRQSMSKTPPPFSRSPSGELLQGQNKTPPSRPNSRTAGAYLNQSTSGLASNQQPATLSAKEQMYVARASGTPLINMASNPKSQEQQTSPGLIGALQAREREKAALTQGMRSNAVHQAIAARQQQQLQMEAEAQAQMQYEMQQRAQQQAHAQMQLDMQQRAQQQAQAQALAQAQWQQMQQQQQAMSGQQQRPDTRRHSSWRLSRPQSMHIPQQQQAPSQAGGYGGQFVQQQGMQPQQGGQRWQQPARR
ncbi:hypothetical protein PRZ48_009340 [Zasmidium cellare]|uniref:PH domain-containing protein n=1 Tax=Zasmidium cellare TaxID=395010 RepID=A0ABR0EBF8_ZASCE|nr:hypothetical protein PRZ48_009340 [Zasmidium cellare]